uniref:Thiolase N-terminal domain-containing protein n=1 Tax=Romanomermis culicivorax TaxID=13658 RepID=A0A915K4J4_ROMCU
MTATDLGVVSSQAALKAANLTPENVDTVIFGNVIQSSKDAAYLSRHVGLRIGLPQHVPALTVNRLCGSGFQAIISAAHEILTGDAHIALAGGAESMSQAPFAVRNIRFGTQLGGNYEFEDTLWQGLTDQLIKTPMGITAENLGAKYNVTRAECDEFSLKSQTRWRLGWCV